MSKKQRVKLENKTTLLSRATLSIEPPFEEGMSEEDCQIALNEAWRDALVNLFKAMADAIQLDVTDWHQLFPFEFILSLDQCGLEYRLIAEIVYFPEDSER